jgi:phosphonate transport system substrate-binding protein
MKSRRSLIALMAVIAAISAGWTLPAAAQAKPVLVFTAIPDQDETRLVQRFTRLAEHLTEKLGVQVKYLPVTSYPAAVTAFTNNQVQLAWFGGFTGVQARRQVPGSIAIAQGAEDVAFKSFIIANVKTGLKKSDKFPAEISGKTFTFGARASTSGRLMPEYFIRRQFAGRGPDEIFARVGFSGDHSRTIQLVQSGAFEVGVVDYSVWELDLKTGKIDKAFGAGFQAKLSAALLAIEDRAILDQFARSKFIPAKNADYKPIEDVAKAVNLLN